MHSDAPDLPLERNARTYRCVAGAHPSKPDPDPEVGGGGGERGGSRARLGKFRIVRELGHGAMGVVYEGFQDDLQRRVAIKLLAPGIVAANTQGRVSFEREARLAASVRHPGVVTVHEVGVADGQAYLAMEFVDGPSLAERIARQTQKSAGGERIDAHECAALVLQIARAVAALHERGIVHRDLKPENVLIDRDGSPRVTDFGLALLRADESLQAAGSPGFMAPEQVRAGFGPVTERADVYALGATLHCLLAGRTPHHCDSAIETVLATAERDLPATLQVPGVPTELLAIVRKCLERQPAQRYANAAELAEDLERWLRGDAPEAVPPGLLRRLSLFFRQRRMLSARLTCLLAFFCWGLVSYAVLDDVSSRFFVSGNLVLLVLTVASLVLDWCNRRGWLERATRYVWPLLDCVGLNLMLRLGDGLQSDLTVLYPLVVVTSGFWLDRSVVAVTTAIVLASYTALMLDSQGSLAANPAAIDGSKPLLGADAGQHLAVYVTIAVTGVLLWLQVSRARALRDHAARLRGWS